MKEESRLNYEKQQNFNALLTWIHSLRYKAILNFFKKLPIIDRPIRVLEIGCAHAKLFEVLNQQFNIDYSAIELNTPFYEEARKRYGHFPNFSVINASASDSSSYQHFPKPDIVIALETLEHIPEKEVVRIIEHIAALSPEHFVCSVPVEVGPAIWFKNLTSFLVGYHRHKTYTWRETFWAGLYQLDKLPPHGTCHKGFDWRWLAATIRQNMQITRTLKFPFNFLPGGLANSVFISARPRTHI